MTTKMKTQQKSGISSYNLLGKQYTFFLSNYDLPNDSFFIYAITSPGMMKDLETPLISLEKIGEKCKPGQGFEQGRDILSYCLGGKTNIDKRSIEWIKNLMRNEELFVSLDGTNFPKVEMIPDRLVQKNLVCGLRDTIRWKYYRFFQGRKIDILWTPNEFVVFNIKGDDSHIWFEPVGVYKNTDFRLEEPIPVDLDIINTRDLHWEKGKISEINQTIRKIEFNSFDTKFRFKKQQ